MLDVAVIVWAALFIGYLVGKAERRGGRAIHLPPPSTPRPPAPPLPPRVAR